MPLCQQIEGVYNVTNMTAIDILSYPTTCFHYFYALILFGLWLFFVLILEKNERGDAGRADLISIMAIVSISMIVVSVAGTLVGIITQDIFILSLIYNLVFVVLWFFKGQ